MDRLLKMNAMLVARQLMKPTRRRRERLNRILQVLTRKRSKCKIVKLFFAPVKSLT